MVAAARNPVPERLYPGIRTTRHSLRAGGNTGSVTVLNGSDARRRELAAFLRSRRERTRPEQVGLPPSRRRRTPGLRREEVAQLAGVGVTWYTWLEQGRDINASPQVLDAVARALQFDAHEHAHLLTLAGLPVVTLEEQCEQLCPTARLLLDRLEPYPACVLNARWDVLAFNRLYASFFPDLDTIPFEERNCLWLAFTDPAWQEAIVDWDEAVGRMVAEYRAAMAEHLDDPAWQSLVERLHRASPAFTAMWDRHDVLATQSRMKRTMHPTVGLLRLDYTNLWLDQRLGTRIVAFTPADEQTAERLERLHDSLRDEHEDRLSPDRRRAQLVEV
jgi:transcriptional regulator with XRE-family HTH domain